MAFKDPQVQDKLRNDLMGKVVSVGSRPYPYVYETSCGTVTSVTFDDNGFPTVTTTAGEVWDLRTKGDLDLIYGH